MNLLRIGNTVYNMDHVLNVHLPEAEGESLKICLVNGQTREWHAGEAAVIAKWFRDQAKQRVDLPMKPQTPVAPPVEKKVKKDSDALRSADIEAA